MSEATLLVRQGILADLSPIKSLADAHRHELGFVLLPSLHKQIEGGEVLIAEQGGALVGFVDYHRRRDGQVTLYHILVAPAARRQGVGRALLAGLAAAARASGAERILLKCPVDLAANAFYQRHDFQLRETLNGRKRALNVWVLPVE
mgnify:CR=1 FL=1